MDLILGLSLLAKYEPSGLESHIGGAEHDVFYGHGSPGAAEISTWSKDDVIAMLKAGWHVENVADRDEDNDGPDLYDLSVAAENDQPFDFERWKAIVTDSDGCWAHFV